MFCQNCGNRLNAGDTVCSKCNAPVGLPPPPPGAPAGQNPVDDLVREVKRSAKELAVASARLSKHLAAKAETAAKDPSGSAKKVATRVTSELDRIANEIDKALRDL